MATRITTLGLGKTGISVGLALPGEKKGIIRVGFDEDKELVKYAKKVKAFDEYASSAEAAVAQADIVILDLPVDRLRLIFSTVAQKMKANSILVNMAPLVGASTRWAAELLPENIYYINAIPAFNYESLQDVNKEPGNARADLFEKSLVFIAGDVNTRQELINVTVDLVVLLGGTPYFSEPDEVDGLIANVIVLPQLIAAALAGATMLQPGWDDNKRLAGNIFNLALKPLELVNEAEDYGISMMQNRKNLLPVLEKYIQVLQQIQQLIIDEDTDGLTAFMVDVLLTRKEWLEKRKEGKWDYYLSSSIPLKQEALRRFSGFSS
ncbi:MAG: Putative prephenate dehydrogenase [Anaerolinea thermophila]|uniref:Putative prephenate dehydrogenase n=1 Tax=Anaerolinea thermophila TaxID=167964 RepID=A0A101FXT0_9CHLR|nr:MAG: Putative prephenate dehydrogenase [Anaerolinea thermophila]